MRMIPNLKMARDADVEPEEEFRQLIMPGEYNAQCIGFKEFRQFGKGKKLVLMWDFTLSGRSGIVLPQYLNMQHKTFKEYSFFYVAWVIANNYRRPRRRTRQYMTPNVFKNIIGKVLVETVIPTFENQTPMNEVFHYSKVKRLLSLSLPNNSVLR